MSRKNAGMIHGTEKNEEKLKGKANLISNVITIALLVSFFLIWPLAIYLGFIQYLMLVFMGLIFLLLLYISIKEIFWPSKPMKYNESDDQLTCKNGHTVSVYVSYDGGISQGSIKNDVTCGASVWPKKCPICGASWLRPGK